MSGSYDAVESGLVSSLAKPGANITGLTVPREVASKQLELLRECIAPLSRAAILIRRDSLTAAKLVEAKALVQAFLQLTLEFFEVGAPEELAPALANLKAWRPGAMLLGPDPLFFQQRDQIIEFARSAKIPAMYPVADFVEVGGLMSYGVGMLEVSRIVTRHVDKILKGAKPGDIPVEEPSTYDLTINLGTARALGLKVAQSFLLRAGRVIE